MNVDLDIIAKAIRDVAAAEILPRWRNLAAGEISQKTGPQDLVTIADQAAEKALSAKLQELYPGSVVVGEEGVEADPTRMDLFNSDKAVWVIDPVDGTLAFASGQPHFDVMLALVQNKKLLAGWIYGPVEDDMLMADKAHGVIHIQKRGARDHLSKPAQTSLEQLSGVLGNKLLSKEQRDFVKSKEPYFTKITSSVCAGHDYAMILRGEAQFAIFGKCMPWDHLPGLAMLETLGFAYSKHDGSPYQAGDTEGGIILAPNAQLLNEIRALTLPPMRQ